MQYRKVQNQAGMNLTPPPPSQNSRAVRWHCTAELERRVAEKKIIIIIIWTRKGAQARGRSACTEFNFGAVVDFGGYLNLTKLKKVDFLKADKFM